MGNEGFYNFLIVAMGNVVSAILMYALQAAWLCQRLIDQDYRQNHGSRLSPAIDTTNVLHPQEIVSSSTVTPKNSAHRTKSRSKIKKLDINRYNLDSSKSCKAKSKKSYHKSRLNRINLSQPYLEYPVPLTPTVEYVNRLDRTLGLRRAFSDINISSTCSEFSNAFIDNNQNYLRNGNINESNLSVTDQDFLTSICTKGYVT